MLHYVTDEQARNYRVIYFPRFYLRNPRYHLQFTQFWPSSTKYCNIAWWYRAHHALVLKLPILYSISLPPDSITWLCHFQNVIPNCMLCVKSLTPGHAHTKTKSLTCWVCMLSLLKSGVYWSHLIFFILIMHQGCKKRHG